MCVHQSPSPSVFGLLSWWMQFKWSWQLSCDITAMCSLVPPCFIMTPHTQHSTHHWHKTWIISCRRVRHVSKYNTLMYSPLSIMKILKHCLHVWFSAQCGEHNMSPVPAPGADERMAADWCRPQLVRPGPGMSHQRPVQRQETITTVRGPEGWLDI